MMRTEFLVYDEHNLVFIRYGMYQHGIGTMCSPEKMECEMWNRQIPAVTADFNNTFPDQKVQYHPVRNIFASGTLPCTIIVSK